MSVPTPGAAPGTAAAWAQLGRVLTLRLGPGEDVLPALEHLLERHGLRSGLIVSGVASLHQLTVRNITRFPERWPLTTDDRTVTTVPGPLEVLATQGNVATDERGDLVVHCHLVTSIGTPAAVTYGGHLVAGTTVATTFELAVAELVPTLERRHDPITRAAELAPRPGDATGTDGPTRPTDPEGDTP